MSNQRKAGIVEGIKTETGARYYKFAGADGAVWFSGSDWIDSEKAVRKRILDATGTMISQIATIADVRKQLDDWSSFRPGRVAEHPGWLGSSFICGDGTWRTAPGQPTPDVIAFEGLTKFSPKGTLEEWQLKFEPFVKGQALPFFVCSLALSGPLLALLPPGTVPPQVELVGKPKTGKSTLTTLASSVWAGVPGKTEGGGECWATTISAFDIHRRNHRDMFLAFDEAALSADKQTDRRETAKAIVMKGSTTSTKSRYTDTKSAPELRSAFLSTTNQSLQDVLRGAGADIVAAAGSRMLSLDIALESPGISIFDPTPPGFDSMEAAVRSLRAAVDEAYGTVGPEFAAGLVNLLAADDAGLRARIAVDISSARERLRRQQPDGDQRHRDMLSTIELAGRLALEFGVLPRSWGDPSAVVDLVYRQCARNANRQQQIAAAELARFVEYLRRQVAEYKVLPLWVPHDAAKYNADTRPILVVRTKQGGIAYIYPPYLQKTLPDWRGFLREMQRQALLVRHESEKGDRLQIHTPTEIKKYGFKRAFAIKLDADAIVAIRDARHERQSRSKEGSTAKVERSRNGAKSMRVFVRHKVPTSKRQ